VAKPYSNHRKIRNVRNSVPILINNNDKQGAIYLIISALSLLLTPILVAIITYSSGQSGVNKDYVSIAVSILNSKDSTPENRKWALRILDRLSPIGFSEESQKQLEGGSGLTNEPIKVIPAYGPKNPFIKKGEPFTKVCAPVKGPSRAWTDEDMADYITKIGKSYADCSRRHQTALAMIDILQQTNKTDAAIASDIRSKTYDIYYLHSPQQKTSVLGKGDARIPRTP
jgi:hypothetical protein